METIKTKGFTAKDMFNAASATPIKEVRNGVINVVDVMVRENTDGETVGYLKTNDGTIFATISVTVVEQLIALVELLNEEGPQDIKIVPKESTSGREYFMLELQ